MVECHIRRCRRDPIEGLPVCGPCRFSYLNGIVDAHGGDKPDLRVCGACGHFVHEGMPCRWHGGSCKDAVADPTLWCPCNGHHPRGRSP